MSFKDIMSQPLPSKKEEVLTESTLEETVQTPVEEVVTE